MTIKVKISTPLKLENKQSKFLSESEKIRVSPGDELSIKSISWENNNHAKIQLREGKLLAGKLCTEFFIYTPDWIIPYSVSPRSIKLDVDYYYQRDNSTNLFGTGDRQCKLTCSAMLANHVLKLASLPDLEQRQKEGGFREPESVYAKILRQYGDTVLNAPHIRALNDLNIKAYYSTRISLEKIRDILLTNTPVPISVDYKRGGHIICLVGYDKDRNSFWAHDPYGSRAGAAHRYNNRGPVAGRYDNYSWRLLDKIYTNYWNKHALIARQADDYITGASFV